MVVETVVRGRGRVEVRGWKRWVERGWGIETRGRRGVGRTASFMSRFVGAMVERGICCRDRLEFSQVRLRVGSARWGMNRLSSVPKLRLSSATLFFSKKVARLL